MYWNINERPGYKIPVRQAPLGGTSPHLNSGATGFTIAEKKNIPELPPAVEVKRALPTNGETDWSAEALRLQAEMDKFRQRQTRRADEAISAERERLLCLFLPLAENLERALRYSAATDPTLHQGVALTLRELKRVLESEGVTRLDTVGQPFTPELHEAVAVMPALVTPGTITEEVEAGYKLGDKLLRPARVVVAG
jgi:molecular chaperone GrpE